MKLRVLEIEQDRKMIRKKKIKNATNNIENNKN